MARAARKTLSELLAVMAALRTPGSGCPWDLEQTFQSIAPYTIEEAYEVADAIASGDRRALLGELGDLLLQVVYHARMAEEEGAFTFADVVDHIANKMLRRHPHVFGTAAERAAGAQAGFWERIKAAERKGQARTPQGARGTARASLLADVPIALPALTRAVKLQTRAAQVGFDWPELTPVLAKFEEELAELQGAIAAARCDKPSRAAVAAVAEELGDVLFVIANLARHLQIDPEASLRGANAKFTRRFRRIEERLAAKGRALGEATLAEMDRVWEEAKAEERTTAPPPPHGRGKAAPFARQPAPLGRGEGARAARTDGERVGKEAKEAKERLNERGRKRRSTAPKS